MDLNNIRTTRRSAGRKAGKVIIVSVAACPLAIVFLTGVYWYLSRDLPRTTTLGDYRPPVISTVFSDDNRRIAEFCRQRRIVVSLSKLPAHLIKAFVATEDARFFAHEGVDFYSILRAFWKNLEAGRIVQGGSTITQQVARSFFLTPERSYVRKIREAILAYRIDRHFSKNEILYLYLNQIYFGSGAYGIEAAAQTYFGKSAARLNLAESALLAGLPRAPSLYSPKTNLKRAEERQAYVLQRMVAEGYLTPAQAARAGKREIHLSSRQNRFMNRAPYYAGHVRQWAAARFGEDKLYEEGLKIYTCLDIEKQQAARKALRKGLRELDKRRGYRGPIRRIEKNGLPACLAALEKQREEPGFRRDMIIRGVVGKVNADNATVLVHLGESTTGVIPFADMRWALRTCRNNLCKQPVVKENPAEILHPGDMIRVRLEKWLADRQQWRLRLEQTPLVQGALVCMAPATGHVKAMIGGRDYSRSQFNRAVQSRRQPGSAFKPIVYAAALDKGYTTATPILDTPLVFANKERGYTWKPDNYDETFHGTTLFRQGVIDSRNIVTLKILQDIGVDYVIDYARRLGVTSPLARNLTLGLGSSGLSLLELTSVYAVFANQGERVAPGFVRKVEDRDGRVIYRGKSRPQRVMPASTAYIITHLLRKVVEEGTGWRVQALQRPAAGKTGTTNNLNDAWFLGYTPRYVTGVWVGFDQGGRSLGKNETGSRAASPIWLYFMKKILAGKTALSFPIPPDVIFARIDQATGLLPAPNAAGGVWACFKKGTVPERHVRPRDAITRQEFFKKNF